MNADSFTLAAAQVEPVYHDKPATLDKTCRWIERAGDAGVDLVVFPETYFPGYPYWRGSVSIPRWTELMVDLAKHSLHVEDEAVEVLGAAADEANVAVVLGANERSDRDGSETLYNSLFFYDRDGNLLGRHRKLMPTHEERAVWGRGDPDRLRTYETAIGSLGGLVCYENHMTLSKAALAALGEEIHTAVWPGFWTQHGHPGDKTRAEDAAAIETCDIYPAVREYAFETQSFVVSTSAYMGEDPPDGFETDELGFNVGAGGSMLINPAGIVKAGPAIGEETLLTAEFSRDERLATKAYFDAMGHYSRWDAVRLEISDHGLDPFDRVDDIVDGGSLTPAAAEAIAAEHDVPVAAVDDVAEAVQER